jgi:hypothetical protein
MTFGNVSGALEYYPELLGKYVKIGEIFLLSSSVFGFVNPK